uniref:Uncharacterized protein n=1 Tax=Siphoviridae sp. cttqT1 TaxID=2827961 RepID=A0A8S5TP11_9CAUD|nr:MAG TPA: hypothetical protein [Siphoviridae sp. cttqT1]
MYLKQLKTFLDKIQILSLYCYISSEFLDFSFVKFLFA